MTEAGTLLCTLCVRPTNVLDSNGHCGDCRAFVAGQVFAGQYASIQPDERQAAFDLGRIDGTNGYLRRASYSSDLTPAPLRSAYSSGFNAGTRARSARMVRRRHLIHRRARQQHRKERE